MQVVVRTTARYLSRSIKAVRQQLEENRGLVFPREECQLDQMQVYIPQKQDDMSHQRPEA